MPAAVRARLAALAAPGGGWGYAPPQSAHLEPTCLAVLALAADRAVYAAAITAGLAVVETHAKPDGSYRLTRGRPQAVWPTALVLFTRTVLGNPESGAIADKLLTVEGRVLTQDPEVADMTDIDTSLMGWPWAEGTFSWVEPTAWACLALRAGGRGDHPRVREGLRLLLDRAFDTGGVNYGNRMILGKSTEPIPGPTAVMLLALQGVIDDPRVDAAVGYLRTHAAQTTDLEHLAWAKLALSAHPGDAATRAALPEIDAKIHAALAAETDAGPVRIALALLALAETSVFHIPGPVNIADAADVRVPATPAGNIPPRPFTERIKASFRGVMVNGLNRLRPLPSSPGVHIGDCPDYDGRMLSTLKAQYEFFRPHMPALAGKRVVLKPNLVEYRQAKVINTDPRFIDAVIQLFKDEGAGEIVVAEGPGHWRNVQFLVAESGLGAVLKKHDVRFVDVNHDEPVKTLNLGRCTGLEYLYCSRTILTADVLVSLPKLKTHHWAGATLALKNLFGTLPGICYGWPKNELHWRGIPNSIVDIACTTTPKLAIVDGIVGMEGDGPLMGTEKHAGVIVMGTDLVAVDATCCRLMGLPPERVATVVLASAKRLGVMKADLIAQLGAAVADRAQAFEMPPNIEKELLPVVAAK